MRSVAIALLLFLSFEVFATNQQPDTLVIGNEKRDVRGIELPERVLARLVAWKRKHDFEGVASYNWKGFYATLRLRNEHLLLEGVSVDAAGPTTTPVPLSFLFGSDGPIHAVWFSGRLDEYLLAPLKFTDILPGGRVRSGVPPDLLRRYTFRRGKLISLTKEVIPR